MSGPAYNTPYVADISGIAQLLAHAADPYARAAENIASGNATAANNIAAAQAHAREVSGDVWGRTIAGIGQSIGAIPQQIEQQKHSAIQDANLQSEINDRNEQAKARAHDLAGQQAGAAAIKASVDPETGQVDHEQAASLWEQAGFPVAANAYRESVQKTKATALSLTEAQQKIDAGNQQAQQALTDHMGELAAVGLQKLKTQTPQEARDTTMGLVANALAHGAVSQDDAHKFLMQTAAATPDQLQDIYQQVLDQAPNVKARALKDALTVAETTKNNAEATKALQPAKPPSLEDQYLAALAAGRTDAAATIRQVWEDKAKASRDPNATAQLAAIRNLTQQEAQARLDARDTSSPQNQQKMEQEYRTVLQRGMSSRSGGIGLEDAKVQQANHLQAIFEQNYDPKTGEYNIPRVQLNELALGLARLTAPGGQAGEGMLKEFQQRTAKGDVAGALTYLTGQPVPANTQAITQMLKDSIERQGKTAETNREGEMSYLRGLAPTDLSEDRRKSLEATSLNPLRQSRVAVDAQGTKRLFVSTDGGQTWK